MIVIIKTVRPEIALSARLCTVGALFLFAVSGTEVMTDYINSFFSVSGIDTSYFKLALKVTGICVITQITSDTCRDCAETALATTVELVGKFLILTISLPIVKSLLEISIGLIK
ncbi:MAG: stage III sporulation AC/AD family protein [Clostridiaceae bacterium]|nr:stage III sporulation AC/AD family protein [Clostridiaceae bacterium]